MRQLFAAMGAEAWTTIPSKDGGVDAVATSKNLFFGGVCLIQAKRWAGLVGLESVHALTGVMADHNATVGVLVTTSWFGRASEQFAQRNRITLINGAELKHLIKEKLGIDVIPGTQPASPPPRFRQHANRTARPLGQDHIASGSGWTGFWPENNAQQRSTMRTSERRSAKSEDICPRPPGLAIQSTDQTLEPVMSTAREF